MLTPHTWRRCIDLAASGDTYVLEQCAACNRTRLTLVYATPERRLGTKREYDHGVDVPLTEHCRPALPPARSQLPTLSEIQTADTERPDT